MHSVDQTQAGTHCLPAYPFGAEAERNPLACFYTTLHYIFTLHQLPSTTNRRPAVPATMPEAADAAAQLGQVPRLPSSSHLRLVRVTEGTRSLARPPLL